MQKEDQQMAYYEHLDSFLQAEREAPTVMIVVEFVDSSVPTLHSSAVPVNDDTLTRIADDIVQCYEGAPLGIWRKETRTLTHVHARDIRAIKLIY
jgi:hypothetical protein